MFGANCMSCEIPAGIENADILQALLEVIPDTLLAARANDRGDTALHVAARARRFHMAELLLDFGSIVDEANEAGNTALHEALKNGDLEPDPLLDFGSIVDEEASSFVDKANEAGNRALHEAVKNGDLELTDLLLRRGSKSVNKENEERKCPLYLAVETGNSEILLRLLQAVDGNEVLLSGIEGMLPVHGAVMHQSSGQSLYLGFSLGYIY
ncbi:hypothetical protein NL676_020946 [Syzygium grande]|nr:hypothetical protein NL676_020946 [Syzygium grande]